MRAERRVAWIASLAAASSAAAAHADIVDAARRDDRAAVLVELEGGAAATARSGDGTTALHWAVYHDDVELVERLLGAGADANAANSYGSTPLREAAVAANAAVVERLLAAGAEPNVANEDGETPLMVLARSSNVEAARLLIEAGADVNAREAWRNQTALIWAAAQKQAAMVTLLLEHGAEPNARSKPNDWDRQVSAERRRQFRPFGGLTALMYAAREGCADCARALVEGGADIDLAGSRNITPLIMALENMHFDTAAYLLEAGAAVDVWDWWGRTPLYMAVDLNTLPRGGRPDRLSTDTTPALALVEGILERGANPNSQLKLLPPYRERGADRGCDSLLVTGATPLLRAAKTFDTAAMRVLIAHGARLDLPNASGVTPLMAAAGYGSIECDIRGYGPGIPHYLTVDVEQKSIEALQVLIDAGGDVNAVTTGGGRGKGPGQTALFGAAFWGWNEVVTFLVRHGAKIDAVDSQGRTAVDAAMGRAGGHDRGASIQVFNDTAELLEKLCGEQPGCALPKGAS
jgi:ankyrin repeat protein